MSSQERQPEPPTVRFSDLRYAVTPPDGPLSEVSNAQYVMSRTNRATARHLDRVGSMMGEVLRQSGFDNNNEDDARIITIARVAGQIHDLGKIGQPDSKEPTIAATNQQISQHGTVIGNVIRRGGVGIIYGAHDLVLTRGLNWRASDIVAKVCDWHHTRIPEGYAKLPDEADQIAWGITALLQPLDRYDQQTAGKRQEALNPKATYDHIFGELSVPLPIVAEREINVQAYMRNQLGIAA